MRACSPPLFLHFFIADALISSQCAAGTAPEHCLYEMSTVQYIDQLDDYHKKHPIPGYPDKVSLARSFSCFFPALLYLC